MARVGPRKVTQTVDVQGKPITFPARLFKFMERRWADALLQAGSFRIGTLQEYRDDEKHDHGVLDREEGVLRHNEHIGKATDILQLSPLTLSKAGVEGWQPGSLSIADLSISATLDADGYIYCLSLSQSWENDIHPDYDACIEIINAHTFMFGLRYSLQAAGRSDGRAAFGPVVYAGRDHETITSENLRSGGPPAPIGFLKPESFARQQEYRAAFMATDTVKIEPYCSENILLARSCEFHSTRPSKKR
jgi:hypothetical protein